MITTPQYIVRVLLTFCVISAQLLTACFVLGELVPVPVALLLTALLLTAVWPLQKPNTMVFEAGPECVGNIQSITEKLGPGKKPVDAVRTGLAIMKLWTDGYLELYITPAGKELESSKPTTEQS